MIRTHQLCDDLNSNTECRIHTIHKSRGSTLRRPLVQLLQEWIQRVTCRLSFIMFDHHQFNMRITFVELQSYYNGGNTYQTQLMFCWTSWMLSIITEKLMYWNSDNNCIYYNNAIFTNKLPRLMHWFGQRWRVQQGVERHRDLHYSENL